MLPGGIASKLKIPFDPLHPNESAYGLKDPAAAVAVLVQAADECRQMYGALDVKWGDVYRFASGTADLPGNGGAGGSGPALVPRPGLGGDSGQFQRRVQ